MRQSRCAVYGDKRYDSREKEGERPIRDSKVARPLSLPARESLAYSCVVGGVRHFWGVGDRNSACTLQLRGFASGSNMSRISVVQLERAVDDWGGGETGGGERLSSTD